MPLEPLTPNTVLLVSLLNELHEPTKPSYVPGLSRFVIDRILNKTVWNTYNEFLIDFKKEATDELVHIIRERVFAFKDFNRLNVFMSDSLKNLKMWNFKSEDMEKPKICQGNIIDIFVRKTTLSLNRMNFSDLVNFYNDCQTFFFTVSAQDQPQLKNLQPSDKVYLEMSAKIENINHCIGFNDLATQIEKLTTDSNKIKISYLKYLNASQHGKTDLAVENLHKFFDQNLRHLFSLEKTESTSNKIGQAILNLTNVNLRHGHYDEALRGIAESLRIAQNNADEESINYCLIYLYNIAGVLGLYKDEMMLTEHAISHSMNLNNPLLMLYSSIYYAQFERLYDTSHKETEYLRSRNISWTDALTFATKKIYSHYENSYFNNKLTDNKITYYMPIILNKLIKSVNFLSLYQPKLLELETLSIKENFETLLYSNKSLEVLMETVYLTCKWDPLKSLSLFSMFQPYVQDKQSSKFSFYFIATNIELCLNRNEFLSAEHLETKLFALLNKSVVEPSLLSLAWSLKNKRLIRQESYAEAYTSCLSLTNFNRRHGFVKSHTISEYLNLALIYLNTGDPERALIQIEKSLSKAKKKEHELYIQALIQKAMILVSLNNANDALNALMKIDESELKNYNSKLEANYYYAKASIFCYLSSSFPADLSNNMISQVLDYFNKALEVYIRLGCLNECREIYYITARLYNDLELPRYREACSQYFNLSDKLISKMEGSKLITNYEMNESKLISIQQKNLELIGSSFKIINI